MSSVALSDLALDWGCSRSARSWARTRTGEQRYRCLLAAFSIALPGRKPSLPGPGKCLVGVPFEFILFSIVG